MKTRVHIGSLPGAYVSRLNVDMLVAVSNENPVLLDAMECKCVGAAFAKTTTGLELFDARDGGFASAKYGLRIDMPLFTEGNHVNSILSAVKGLGVKSLAVYIASPVHFQLDIGDVLKCLDEWLKDNPGVIDDLYVLANGWGINGYASCLNDGDGCCSMSKARCVGMVGSYADRLWYYKGIGNGMASIVHVARHQDQGFLHNLEKLTVPEMLGNLRVVKIEDDAFVQTPADGDVSWINEVKELKIPRYVSQMRTESILDSLPALEQVAIDLQNHCFEGDERMLIRRMK